MVMDEVIARCAKGCPEAVMARLALQHALEPTWINELFEREKGKQYRRELLFSTTVELMSLVAVGLRPSLHAALQQYPELPVSLQAVYDKIRHTEPTLVRALVTGSAARLGEVLRPMIANKAPTVPGYQLRIVDGSHLPGTEKRLKPLRDFGGAPLPGHSLVVYDPDLQIIVDLEPCEDAYTQERVVMSPLLDRARPGELWIADRAFSTRAIIAGWNRSGCSFIVREHSSAPHPTVVDEVIYRGRIDTGCVYEQAVEIKSETVPVTLRRIELRLKSKTTSGEAIIRILSNLPEKQFSARAIARLYRHRWKIESMFQRLESVLHSEVKTLAHPRSALFAFGIAILAYNVLSVLQAAVWAAHEHELHDQGIELSPYYVALEVKVHYAGMMTATLTAAWQCYDTLNASQLRDLLLDIAAHARPKTLRKHPRGPKKPKKTPPVSLAEKRRHVSTARVLKDGFIR